MLIRRYSFVVMLTLLSLVNLSTSLRADEDEVRAAIADYVDAFNEKDVDTLTKMWAKEAVHVDLESNAVTDGRDAIIADMKSVFENNPTLSISGTIEHIKLIRDDIATLSGNVILSSLRGNPTVSHFNAVLLKSEGVWQIEKMEESPEVQPSNARAALSRLNWLVGNWEETSGTSPVRSRFSWSQNETFLIRITESKDQSGTEQRVTQIIGWDPRSSQIRSWTFQTDGSFGEGIWTDEGGSWQIYSTQVLSNGSQTNGTYVINRTDSNTFTLQLISREIDGELQPASDAVTVKRVVESPVEATPSKP